MSDETPEVDYAALADQFITRVDAVMVEVFGEPSETVRPPAVVIGLQVGDALILSSNLGPCQVGPALHDMHDMAMQQHNEHHAELGPAPYMTVDDADVPEEVREYARQMAEQYGVAPENIVVRAAVDTEDLNDEGIAQLIGTPFGQGDDEVPQTVQAAGHDDIASEDMVSEGGANTAEAEQDFESGRESDSREYPDGAH